jgi:hypothetical protein
MPPRGSNYGDWIDIAAPGGDKIITTQCSCRDNGPYYNCATSFSGTSASCPVVSGTAALVLSANPLLVGEDLEQVLTRTARNVVTGQGDTGWDQYTGAGLVRADAALSFVVEPRRLRHDLSGVLTDFATSQVTRTFKGVDGLVDNQAYTVNRHQLQTTFTWSAIYALPPDAWVRGSGTLGIRDMSFYDNTREVMGGNVVSVSAGSATQPGSATVETYVYEVLRPGQSSLWFPVTTTQARVAMTAIGSTAPARIALTGDVITTTKATVYWTAPGNDGYVGGKVDEYDLRYGTTPITDANWYNYNRASTPNPANPGTVQQTTIKNLTPCTHYYFAIKALDHEGNLSPISNVVHGQTLCGNGAVAVLPSSLELDIPRDSGNRGPAVLSFGIPESQAGQTLQLTVYDISGRLVRTLKQEEAQAGRFTENWNLQTDSGRRAGAGVYFVKLRVGTSAVTRRLVVIPGSGEE